MADTTVYQANAKIAAGRCPRATSAVLTVCARWSLSSLNFKHKNMSIKTFFMKQMLKRQGVPEGQIDMILAMMEKNPELFKKIAEEVKEKTKAGMDQTTASMFVMKKY